MPAIRLRSAALFCALLLGLPSAALAGPSVTFALKDGRTIEADIQMFYDGRFSIRDRQTLRLTEIRASSIRTIDFGEAATPESLPPGANPPSAPPAPARVPVTLANVRQMAEQHRFEELLRAFGYMAAVRLKRLDGELVLELDRPALTPEVRRDLGLARVLSLWSLGQDDYAKSTFAKIRAGRPADAVIEQFNSQMSRLKRWSDEQPTLPEKKP